MLFSCSVGVFGNEDNQPNMISKPSILALEVARDRNIESEEDNLWRPDVRESEEEILARALQFMTWLWKRPEKEVAVVSHGIVLQHMLYVFANDCDVSVRHELCKRFANCEIRTVVIVDKMAMQTSVGIFRGQEDMNQSDIFPKVNNSPPIVSLEICRERMIESDEDTLWQAEEREDMEDVSARGLHFLKWLWERPEKDIAVVSHGIFLQQTLRALHEKVGTPVEDNHLKRFANCELRSIRLEKSDMEAYTLTTYNSRKYATPPSTSIHTFE
ncbi:hypothetical protein F2Q68_00013144 [Brassica cretica]|uniref:Phosphoglycerate mutase-like protein 1 n=1 Tax=Brassica cretica TaxID=69181 RepID=A0A8S9HMF2_BRACR|nr:hypothetical protein F2Q68_00013144 [Brassica cretica]